MLVKPRQTSPPTYRHGIFYNLFTFMSLHQYLTRLLCVNYKLKTNLVRTNILYQGSRSNKFVYIIITIPSQQFISDASTYK